MKIEKNVNNISVRFENVNSISVRFENVESLISLVGAIPETAGGVATELREKVREIESDIVNDYLYSLPISRLVEIWNRHLDMNALSDHFINDMVLLDYVLTECTTLPKSEILRMAYEGNFKYNDDYFYFSLNDTLCSFSSLCDSPIVIDELAVRVIQDHETFGDDGIKKLLEKLYPTTVQ